MGAKGLQEEERSKNGEDHVACDNRLPMTSICQRCMGLNGMPLSLCHCLCLSSPPYYVYLQSISLHDAEYLSTCPSQILFVCICQSAPLSKLIIMSLLFSLSLSLSLSLSVSLCVS